MKTERVYALIFASVYPHYVAKAEKKGRTQAEVDECIRWLTGYDEAGFAKVIEERVDMRTFFDQAPKLNPNVALIKATVCGIRVEDIDDPLMQKIHDVIEKGQAYAAGPFFIFVEALKSLTFLFPSSTYTRASRA